MPQLDISTYLPQLFWLFVIFSLFLAVITYWILPRIFTTLERRRKLMFMRNETAELNKYKAAEVIQSVDGKLQHLANECEETLRRVRKEQFKIFTEQRDAIKSDIKAQIQSGVQCIKKEIAQLEEEISDADIDEIVQQFIKKTSMNS